jgi:hypothetical protein
MNFKIENKSALKTFCLRRKLRNLEYKRDKEISTFIEFHPTQAARMDNIEKNINSESLKAINFKITAIQRLLSQYSKN